MICFLPIFSVNAIATAWAINILRVVSRLVRAHTMGIDRNPFRDVDDGGKCVDVTSSSVGSVGHSACHGLALRLCS